MSHDDFEGHLRQLVGTHGGRLDVAATVQGPAGDRYGGDVVLTFGYERWKVRGNVVTPLAGPVPPVDDRCGTCSGSGQVNAGDQGTAGGPLWANCPECGGTGKAKVVR